MLASSVREVRVRELDMMTDITELTNSITMTYHYTKT